MNQQDLIHKLQEKLTESVQPISVRGAKGNSAEFCDECGDPIPVQRQQALRGVRHCIQCQSDKEATAKHWRH